MNTREDILNIIDEQDVEFIRLQFTDIFGNLKNVAITPGQFERVADGRYSFDGSSVFEGCSEETLYLKPDLDSFVILPWRPKQGKVGKFTCSVLTADGEPYELCPRNILKRNLSVSEKEGLDVFIDPECEFFLFHTDENGLATTISHEQAGYMDVGPVDLGENARRDMVLALEDMGFDIKSSHHEKAPGQHEIDFTGASGVKACDDVMAFKFAVRSVAKGFGLHATFMPSPLQGQPGSGMHLRFSLYKDMRNIFNSSKETAEAFAAGVLKHAGDIMIFTDPLVNSYKRIAKWKDDDLTSAKRDLVSVHEEFGERTVEVRFPDSSANIYVAVSLILRAGLEGINEKLTYETSGYKGLPGNLKDAVDKAAGSAFVKDVLGEGFTETFLKAKISEWEEYLGTVSDWELNKYLLKV